MSKTSNRVTDCAHLNMNQINTRKQLHPSASKPLVVINKKYFSVDQALPRTVLELTP
jgi:hypothetical protein